MTRLRNWVLAVHHGALATANLVTGGVSVIRALPYVASLPMVAALTLACFALDPPAFDDGGEFDAKTR